MRVKESALNVIDETYFLDGDVYNGVVYLITNNIVYSIFNVVNGHRKNRSDDFFSLCEWDLSIDASLCDDIEEEPFYYKDAPFTGVAYDFDDSYCVGAKVFENGYILTTVSWFKSGVVGYYESFNQGFSEFSTWSIDGKRCYYKLFIGSFRLDSDFDENNKIKRLSIFGGEYKTISECYKNLKFFISDDLKCMLLSDELYLSGDGIDIGVINALAKSPSFMSVNKITLSRTNLSNEEKIKIKKHYHMWLKFNYE